MTRTVFILGAGASKEVGLPVGTELTEIVADKLKFGPDIKGQTPARQQIIDALKFGVSSKDPRCVKSDAIFAASQAICDAMPLAPSIDNFIHTHNENKQIELCGKLAITAAILDAERSSKLYVNHRRGDSSIEFESAKNTWFSDFLRLLTTIGTIDDLRRRLADIALVVFNYDRCIEHFLYFAFQSYYRITPGEAAELVKGIDIFHPYGRVGHLPWHLDGSKVEYGQQCDGKQLFTVAKDLRTFTEGTDPDSSEIAVVRQRLIEADQMVFLGFHFHKLNIDLLFPPNERMPRRSRNYRVFATAKGFTFNDQQAIRRRITSRIEDLVDPIFMEDCTCHDLFQRNQVNLSLE